MIAPRSIGSPATAKNVLAVGAAEGRTDVARAWRDSWPEDFAVEPIALDRMAQADGPQGLAAFSGRGPCAGTTSATSAFITYLLVVLVPVIGVVRTGRRPAPNVVLGVVLAVAGLAFLSGGVDGLGRGEVLTMGAALAFAVHIVVLGEVSGRHDPIRFTFWQVLTVGMACLLPGAATEGGYGFDVGVWAAAAFCGVAATALAFWCMTWGQRVVPESQAAIILLLEPVSAGILGEVVGDHLGPAGLAGAVLILAAVVVAELAGPRPPAVGAELAVVPPDP